MDIGVEEMAGLADLSLSTVYSTFRKIENNDSATYAELLKKSGTPHKDYSPTFDLIKIIGEDAFTQKGIQTRLEEEGVELATSS